MDKVLKSSGLIFIAILVIGGICLFSIFGGLGNLFGGNDDVTTLPDDGSRPGMEQPGTSGETGQLGRLYTAVDVDRSGCPTQTATEFYRDETVYAGVEESIIPAGTTLFMRLYREGQAVEDSPPIQADQDMSTCVWFEFTPDSRAGFEPGDYQAELIVNGNSVDEISFEIADQTASGGGGLLPGTGSGDVELGQVVASTQVDQSGCPTNSVNEFYADEPVYLSVTESFIPEGTEVFARLNHEGQAIEDSDPIYADQDMETCIWFEFTSGVSTGGFEPGNYEAELFVNGSQVDAVQFTVQ